MHSSIMQSLQPKVEKMEAAWARLHTITGAETPEEVIAYFKGKFSQRILCHQCCIMRAMQTSCFCRLPVVIFDGDLGTEPAQEPPSSI